MSLRSDLALTLAYGDGSLASVVYATGGHVATPKEHIVVLGRGHTIELIDFHTLVIDGKSEHGAQDKGHAKQLEVASGPPAQALQETEDALTTMRATMAAVAQLLS